MKQQVLIITLLTIIASFSFAQEMPKDTVIEPFKIDNRLLSGLDIPQYKLKSNPNREYYQKRIYNGSELSVYIMSSETVSNKINNFPIDEFVYYLNGKADISAKDSTTVTFYSGDYFFVPKGFSGNWTNNGIKSQKSPNLNLMQVNLPLNVLKGISFISRIRCKKLPTIA